MKKGIVAIAITEKGIATKRNIKNINSSQFFQLIIELELLKEDLLEEYKKNRKKSNG